jgi:alkylhydroperoxidase family enzyme
MFDRRRAESSPVTDLHRWLGLAPDALAAWLAFAPPLQSSTAVEPAIRELVILRVAHRLGAARTVRHHAEQARDAGLSDDQLRRLDGPIPAEVFGPCELDALEIVDLVLEGHALSNAQLRADGLLIGQVVHVVMLVAHYGALIALLQGFDLT